MSERESQAHSSLYDKKVGLVLQGGGALGSYQAGVYAALASSQYLPDWVAGISIGAINAAIIAGNAPEQRVAQLRRFWEDITAPRMVALRPDRTLRHLATQCRRNGGAGVRSARLLRAAHAARMVPTERTHQLL